MPESIFFIPGKQKEDALTHTFLSVLEQLSPSIRNRLLHDCKLNAWSKDAIDSESIINIEIRVPLSDRSIPDAMIRIPSSNLMIIFENKLGQPHTTEQLGRYYKQVLDEQLDVDIRVIAATDARFQSRFAVKGIAEEAGIPQETVDILVWQDANAACTGIITEATSGKIEIVESDLLLLRNLVSFMEELGCIPFKGLAANELKGYVTSSGELELLDSHLRQQVPLVLPALEAYSTRSVYGKISGSWLGFPFKRAHGVGSQKWTFLFIQLFDDGLCIGISLASEKDRKVILEHIELGKLRDALKELPEYVLLAGESEEEEVEPNKLMDADTKKSLLTYFEISRVIDFEALESSFALNSPRFPSNITKELQKLSRVVELIDSALTR